MSTERPIPCRYVYATLWHLLDQPRTSIHATLYVREFMEETPRCDGEYNLKEQRRDLEAALYARYEPTLERILSLQDTGDDRFVAKMAVREVESSHRRELRRAMPWTWWPWMYPNATSAAIAMTAMVLVAKGFRRVA